MASEKLAFTGLFWADEIKPKGYEEPKRQPPEPVWLSPHYLPNYDRACIALPAMCDDAMLVQHSKFQNPGSKCELVFDIECYRNYFLIAFKNVEHGWHWWFDMRNGETCLGEQHSKLKWICENYTLISFNGLHYDQPILTLALAHFDTTMLKVASDDLIVNGIRPNDLLKLRKVKKFVIDHIDLREIPIGSCSLKTYGGRLHARTMQDLPFDPGTDLSDKQITITRWYCLNDLVQTELLFNSLSEQIALREQLGIEYGLDLRSKSDAQIAEAVITKELQKLNGGQRIAPPVILPGTSYKYKVPKFIRYQTPLMNHVLDTVRAANFVVAESGSIRMPDVLSGLEIRMVDSVYRMGIGGLHSSEETTSHLSDDNFQLIDRDVTSYYPAIILNLGLYPQHLGTMFLRVYGGIVDRRVAAKKAGKKTIADTLKIVVNGSFGKLGSMFSNLYSPDLLIQVTITGQLSLLMLIETLELAGIHVVSANTDGVVSKVPTEKRQLFNEIFENWSVVTGFETEEVCYNTLYSRDVNSYIAVTDKGKVKVKGAFAETGLSKNPAAAICNTAVVKYLTSDAPLADTIRECNDPRQFVFVRNVKGGAVKDGVMLGKVVRWYMGTGVTGEIVYAQSGNKVPRSDGAMPLMDMSQSVPCDLDYSWYISEAEKILQNIGVNQ